MITSCTMQVRSKINYLSSSHECTYCPNTLASWSVPSSILKPAVK